MKVTIMDYARNTTSVEIGNIEDVATIAIKVITGDEILQVLYTDYTIAEFDSSDSRMADYYDGEYEIYDFRKPKEENLLFNDKWLSRKNSYDCMW